LVAVAVAMNKLIETGYLADLVVDQVMAQAELPPLVLWDKEMLEV
jgi:hypothetical protein